MSAASPFRSPHRETSLLLLLLRLLRRRLPLRLLLRRLLLLLWVVVVELREVELQEVELRVVVTRTHAELRPLCWSPRTPQREATAVLGLPAARTLLPCQPRDVPCPTAAAQQQL